MKKIKLELNCEELKMRDSVYNAGWNDGVDEVIRNFVLKIQIQIASLSIPARQGGYRTSVSKPAIYFLENLLKEVEEENPPKEEA